MTLIGYTMMCEQAGPKQLVRDVALAEEAGFGWRPCGMRCSPRPSRSSGRCGRAACAARKITRVAEAERHPRLLRKKG
jgi:hypothetical protein